MVDKADHLYRLEGGEYDDEEFEKFPDRYNSIFADKVILYYLSHCLCLVSNQKGTLAYFGFSKPYTSGYCIHKCAHMIF